MLISLRLSLRIPLGCFILVTSFCSQLSSGLSADETTESAARDNVAKDLLRTHIGSFKVASSNDGKSTDFKIAPDALLSYTDPARNYLAGGLWKIGESGRPKGLIAIELWPDNNDPLLGTIHEELNSFAIGGMELRNRTSTIWNPSETTLTLLPLTESSQPAPTAERRLLQMKTLARKFAVTEIYRGDSSVLRMLPRQIDRYEDTAEQIQDAAMFAFVSGTNPELIVIVECCGNRWQYGLTRLSWAELRVEFDGKEVRRFDEMTTAGPNDAYTSHRESVSLPVVKN